MGRCLAPVRSGAVARCDASYALVMAGDTPSDAQHLALAGLTEAVRLLDRGLAPRQKVQAFTRAAQVVATLEPDEVAARVAASTLTELDGIGPSTGSVITDSVLGKPSAYLAKLEASVDRRSRGRGSDP